MATTQGQIFAVIGGNTGALNMHLDTTYEIGTSIPLETKGMATASSSTIAYLPANYACYDCVVPDNVKAGILQIYVDGSPTTVFINLASSTATNPGRTKLSVTIPAGQKVEFRVAQKVVIT